MFHLSLIFIVIASIFVIIYGGYYLFVYKNLRRDYGVQKDTNYMPKVSIIIPVFNEEKMIYGKLVDTLAIDYPQDKMEIVVFDDGSKDNTSRIARSFANKGVRVIEGGINRGKSAAINMAFEYTGGDIVVITDADCRLEKDVLLKAMPYFADPKVGAITGNRQLMNPDENIVTQTERSLQDHRYFIRRAESAVDSAVIFSGEFIAFRRRLVKLEEDMVDDTQLAIETRKKGYRALFLEEAKYYEFAPSNFRDRWKQKVRRSAQAIQPLIRNRDLFFNKKYGIYGSLIFPAEFFMHVVSPYLLVTMGALAILLLFLNFSTFIILLAYTLVVFLGIAIAISLYLRRTAPDDRRPDLLSTSLAFIHGQISLLIGSLTLIRATPHKWDQITDVRRFGIKESASTQT